MLCLANISAWAQHVEENLSSEKRRLEQSEKQHGMGAANRIQKHFMDSLSQATARRKTFSFVDSLGHLYKAVPSEKWLSSVTDSLHLDRFQNLPEMKIVTRGELIQHIRQDFLSDSERNIPTAETTKGMRDNIMPHIPELPDVSRRRDSLERSAQFAMSRVPSFRLPGPGTRYPARRWQRNAVYHGAVGDSDYAVGSAAYCRATTGGSRAGRPSRPRAGPRAMHAHVRNWPAAAHPSRMPGRETAERAAAP